ncbi:MAG TPA: class II fructose-1,6-bisphosphate aldolase [Bacilli bacterium]|nr:class II fructose-1,6-bisphosphate aldolase [Bacilli bacterium]
MIENMNKMLKKAYEGKYAVPHFNINNLEWTRYILEECEEMHSPVIIGVSEGAIKYMGGYQVVASLVRNLCNGLKITVPVAIHLDHGSSVESCNEALKAGFTSVMIDASKYEVAENINITKQVVKLAKKYKASVEAEMGHVGGQEDNMSADLMYAKVEDCKQMVDNVKLDAFAPALGSVHGLYKGEPNLDFDRMKQISDMTKMPLVLHGGTGIPDDKIKRAIECGTCKINVNTELQIAWRNGMVEFLNNNQKAYDPRKVIGGGETSMKTAIKNKILLFGSENKA